jgi:WXG100 family type VII secretion target
MAGNTKLNYDEMQGITKSFQSNQQEMEALLSQTKSKVEALHNNQWVGEAADRFFNEMEGPVFKSFSKLVTALGVANHVSTQVMNTIHQADESTKGYFGSLV